MPSTTWQGPRHDGIDPTPAISRHQPLSPRSPGRHAGDRSGVPMAPDDPLPALSLAELETLLAALDPRLDGFGEGESCLDDAVAYLARLGIPTMANEDPPALILWLEGWRIAGGDRRTLRLMVTTLLAQQRGSQAA